MGFTMPQPLEVDSSGSIGASVSGSVGAVVSGSLGAVGPVTVAGIPDTFHIDIDKLPKIELSIDKPVTLHLDPVDLNLSIKEIPNTRAHLPADFSVGISLLGVELLCVRLCGEAQMITEPYHPNPCERCGEREIIHPDQMEKEGRERKAGGLNARKG